MDIKIADVNDFDIAFKFIEALWDYNKYNKTDVKKVYNEVINDNNSFAFFVVDEGQYKGFCHGDYFNTFWMSGKTCYVSSLITNEQDRGKGYGTFLLNYAKKIAKDNNCRAMILDSGLPRLNAHKFYEKYGFEKSCYGFELML